MKKLWFFAIIVNLVFLSGCIESRSIGIIGGADGPTAIYVNNEWDETKTQEKKPVRMLMADGALYYDTGKVSDIDARCGTLDGHLEKTCGTYEIPKKERSCNFDGAEGYQSASGLIKEVPVDGEWVIFKKLWDPEKDLTRYRYGYYLKGTLPNAEKESELLVLCQDKNLDFERVSKSMLSSSSEDFLDLYIVGLSKEDRWGVRLLAREVTPKGLTLSFEQFGGAPTGELSTGDWFSLEENRDGEWVLVETRFIEYAWNSVAYRIPKNDETTMKVDWEWLYGELPEGVYRIGKEVMDLREPGDFDEEIYFAEFSI